MNAEEYFSPASATVKSWKEMKIGGYKISNMRFKIINQFRSKENVEYLRATIMGMVPPETREYISLMLKTMVLGFDPDVEGTADEAVPNDTAKLWGILSPTDFWQKVRDVNLSFINYTVSFAMQRYRAIVGTARPYEDEPYQIQQLIADSLRPVGAEDFNGGIPYKSYVDPHIPSVRSTQPTKSLPHDYIPSMIPRYKWEDEMDSHMADTWGVDDTLTSTTYDLVGTAPIDSRPQQLRTPSARNAGLMLGGAVHARVTENFVPSPYLRQASARRAQGPSRAQGLPDPLRGPFGDPYLTDNVTASAANIARKAANVVDRTPIDAVISVPAGVDPYDWGWSAANPSRSADEAIAEYWGDSALESSAQPSWPREREGRYMKEMHPWIGQRENEGRRRQNYTKIPRWQRGGHVGYDLNIRETLGTSTMDDDSQVRRWDMTKLKRRCSPKVHI